MAGEVCFDELAEEGLEEEAPTAATDDACCCGCCCWEAIIIVDDAIPGKRLFCLSLMLKSRVRGRRRPQRYSKRQW